MSTVMVDHNYPTTDALRVLNAAGEPVENAVIRIFRPEDFYSSNTSTWEASTTSDLDGYWVDPIALDSALTWVVHIQKPTVYGPGHVEITT